MTESAQEVMTSSWSSAVIDGIMYPPYVTRETLERMKNYETREDDVWIVTYPKAGTHWIREIVSLIYVDGEVEAIDRNEYCRPLEFGDMLIDKQPRPSSYPSSQSFKSPRTLVTHIPEDLLPRQIKEGKGKVVYVIRNPKDSAVSNWFFLKDRRKEYAVKWDTYIQDVLEGKASYGPWYKHVKQYWERHRTDKNFIFVHYEDFKKDHRNGVIKLAEFIGHPLSDEAIDKVVKHSSLEGMSRTHHTAVSNTNGSSVGLPKKVGAPKIIRKGVVGDWKNYFTVSQSELLDSISRKELDGTGINVTYE
ncbi:sulfotransferase 1B1-like [Amphiura filiformis]|uniref:sulfotransferase 1B1-like n=1 Tax=Amphiura filiformis TaxID=82378 RepID=UPI003B2280E6